MRVLLVSLFVASLLAIAFLALNYIWEWFFIHYGTVRKIILSALVLSMVGTGIAMVFSATYSKNSNHPTVGKKDL